MFKARLLTSALAALCAIGTVAVAQEPVPSERTQRVIVTPPEVSVPVVKPPVFTPPVIRIPEIPVNRTPIRNLPPVRAWMSPEIGDAWRQGFQGQGTSLTIIDSFSGERLTGNIGYGVQSRAHGFFTSEQAIMTAPRAGLRLHDLSNNRVVALNKRQLNVLNLSYGMFGADGLVQGDIVWGAREGSILSYARSGAAVVVKAAGNDSVAVGTASATGDKDYLAAGLIGAGSAIFVGALDRHGTVEEKATITRYSNVAGEDARVQDQFLLVGVRTDLTGLSGTSFAAPIVSGYAAVLGSKFTGASPVQITNRLLETARTDTINDYDRAVHGRGEASIGRALAPVSIR